MIKKIILTILCFVIIIGMITFPVNAVTITETGQNDIPVNYSVEESFSITVPAGITIDGATGKSTIEVSATNVVLEENSRLNVSISSENYNVNWRLVDTTDSKNSLSYTIGTEDEKANIFNKSLVLSVETGEAYNSTKTETLYFCVIDDAIKASTYNDILVFTVEIEQNLGTLLIDGRNVKIVTDISEMEYEKNIKFTSAGIFTTTDVVQGRVTSANYILKVNGGETIKLHQNVPGLNIAYSFAEFTDSSLSKMNPNGHQMTHWFTGNKTLQEDTQYVLINFLSDSSVILPIGGANICEDFTDEQIVLLPTCLELIVGGTGDDDGDSGDSDDEQEPDLTNTLTTPDGYVLEKVYSPSNMTYQDKVYFVSNGVFSPSPSGNKYRVSSTSHILTVFGTETLKLKQNIPGVTLKFAIAEFGESGLGSFVSGGQDMSTWVEGNTQALTANTRYVIINFAKSDDSAFTAEEIALLPTCLELTTDGSGDDDTPVVETVSKSGKTLEVVESIAEMTFVSKNMFNATNVFGTATSAKDRATSITHILKVNGGETLELTQNISGATFKFAIAEFDDTLGNFVGQDMSTWIEGSTTTLTENTRYVIINFAKTDNSNITNDEAALLNTCLSIKKETAAEKPDSGFTISILGDSISTYPGYSNNTTSNSNIADNKPSSGIPQYNAVTDTWWHQAITELDIGLLVNNSESGEKVTVKGVEKSSQLHDDTGDNAGEEPDLVVIYMGTNDFRDGVSVDTYKATYETMIQTIQRKYTETDLFLFTIPYNTMRNDVALLESYNAAIKDLAATYGCTVVDLYAQSGINASNMSTYYYDVCHPRPVGMDIITNLFVDAYHAKYGA